MKALRFLLKMLVKGAIGCAALILINLAGSLFSFHIPLNAVSSFTAGLLGIPGIVLLSVIGYMFL